MRRENRRSNNDRRQEKSNAIFPLRCSNNATILKDRRVRCERRVESLEVSESEISQEVFMSMLKYSNTNVDSTSAQKFVDVETFDNCIIKD